MKLKLSFAIFSMVILFSANAQKADSIKYWKAGGFGSVTFSNVALRNWSGGGEPSVALNGIINLFADYAKDRSTWENTLDFAYGRLKQGERGGMVKSDDKINLVTKYGYKIQKGNEKWYYSGLLNFNTQFDQGLGEGPSGRLDSVISRFMAPAYLTLGLGIDYKPNKVFSFNYVPVTGKFTYVSSQKLADLGAYGVPKGRKARGEFGSYLRLKYKADLFENVNLDSRLELFTNYVEDFGVIDVSWQNNLVMKINKFLTASFYAQIVYDRDVKQEMLDELGEVIGEEAKVQLKSVLGVGLSYSFGYKKEQ